MTAIVQIADALLSWPACVTLMALLFRDEIGEALRRLRLVKVAGFEGRLDEPRPHRTRKRDDRTSKKVPKTESNMMLPFDQDEE